MSDRPLSFGHTYFSSAMEPVGRDWIIEVCRAAQERLDFDTVVVTGVSGCVVGGLVAQALGVHLAVVRKEDDTSTHSYHRVEGFMGHRWVFLDDLVDTGSTRRHVKRAIAARVDYLTNLRDRDHRTRFVGSIEYQDGVVTAANGRRLFRHNG